MIKEYETDAVHHAYREALNQAMREEMERDDSIFLMGEEVGHYNGAYKVSQGLLAAVRREARHRHADRRDAASSASASARRWSGLRPIIEFMTCNFSLVAIDQIVNNAAKIRQMSGGQFNVPIVFRGPGGPAVQVGVAAQRRRSRLLRARARPQGRDAVDARRTRRACSRPRSATTTRSSSSRARRSTARQGEVPDGE